jgi:hypothetical protein
MKRKLIGFLTVSCLLAISSLNSVAQEKKQATREYSLRRISGVEVSDSTFKLLTSQFARSKVVKGAPYSAMATTEHIQTLSGGNQIIRKNESKMYRDSEGRTRSEQRLDTIGKWTAQGEAPQRIFITDPVGAVSYSLGPRATEITTYRLSSSRKKPGVERITQHLDAIVEISQGKPHRPQEDSKLRLKRAAEVLQTQIERTRELAARVDQNVGQKKTESLGTQTIEGVTAEGTRSTLTIPAGEIGNTLPLEIVDESWYSPELQVIVMTKHSDPRTGETTYRLTNINRSEPASSLFEIPDDVKVRGKKLIRKPRPTKEAKEKR